MASKRRSIAFGMLLTASIVSIGACGSTQKQDNDSFYTSEEYEQNRPEPEPPPDPCRAEGGEPRDCKANEDCCEGYVCSLDPERSRVRRYCLEG